MTPQETGEVAAVAGREEVGNRVGAELPQVRRDEHGDQHVAAGPAEHVAEAVIAERVERAGHADERGRRHPVGAGRHAVVEGRHAASGDVIFGDLHRPRDDADDGVDREREEDEQVADDAVGQADLLEDGEEDDKGEEAAGIDAVDSCRDCW